MSTENRPTGLRHFAGLSLAFAVWVASAVMLGASTPTAAANDRYDFGLVTPTPMAHVPMSATATYAQLIRQLQSQDYADIKVTPLSPNRFDPRPELMHPDLTFVSADDETAQATPIHFGWNGTAVRDGRRFEVYVDRAPR